jgi:hypothetical protein
LAFAAEEFVATHELADPARQTEIIADAHIQRADHNPIAPVADADVRKIADQIAAVSNPPAELTRPGEP